MGINVTLSRLPFVCICESGMSIKLLSTCKSLPEKRKGEKRGRSERDGRFPFSFPPAPEFPSCKGPNLIYSEPRREKIHGEKGKRRVLNKQACKFNYN